MDEITRANRTAWHNAGEKYLREYDELLTIARAGESLTDIEREVLADVLRRAPDVVHLQSGDGVDDASLVRAGAASVVGVDYSEVAVPTVQRRAVELGLPCRYVVGVLPGAPLAAGCADLVYTGKGALIWMPDLDAWAADIARLLRPSGHLFVYDGHPAFSIWTTDEDYPRVRPDRSYFARSYVGDDTFPGYGAVEFQWTIGQIVTAVARAGLEIVHLAEHPEPFWRYAERDCAAWGGRLPNTFSLLARRRGEPPG
ncbi:class I SAM-dependent methyltransferase [Cryptosporangium sp. NPDC051539]|uniref:class I SAM-dependent methyltransferase n=1 Tax=Cryptosporangium sp. NPDC051539 TaxID=3363962 RepID=UPI00379A2199